MRNSKIAFACCLMMTATACSDTPVAPNGAAVTDRSPDVSVASVSVVMSGLNSPRGMAWGPEGGLYVAEAGTPVAGPPCATVVRGANCYSGSGSISRLWKGVQSRVATGLPSSYIAAMSDIVGPQDVGFQGRGGMYVSIGWGGDPAARAQLGALGEAFGTLLAIQPSGHWRIVADIVAYEGAHNPAGGPVDANPYGLLAEAGGRFVVDAGGNSLLHAAPNGAVSLIAVFPAVAIPSGPFNPPFAMADAVPTEVQRGPDGALYVSTLTGVPFLPGAAAIYRVVPGQPPQLYAGGFTQITDFDWAPDGGLYVLQHGSGPFFAPPGTLVRMSPGGARTTIATGLVNPTSVLVGSDGAVYVSHKVHVPSGGEVLRIVP